MTRSTVTALASTLLLVAGCSYDGPTSFGSGGEGGEDMWQPTGGPSTGQGGGAGSSTTGTMGSGGSTSSGGDGDDLDHDGFTKAQGDCDDVDPNINPNAVDWPTPAGKTPVDEDCDGVIDNAPSGCDGGLALQSLDAFDAAKAVDLCPPPNPKATWGVKDARWVRANGGVDMPASSNYRFGHGILDGFGPNVHVQRGESFLVLSSGSARVPGQADYRTPDGFDKGYKGQQPAGYPKQSSSCDVVAGGEVHDDVAIELTIQAPANVRGFSFDFNFFTYEWPSYVCSQFNDFFIASLAPSPGAPELDLSFDPLGNPISVNVNLLEVCDPPGTYGGQTYGCALGKDGLVGTGFEGHGSTSWVVTKAPVQPNTELRIRWAVYDSGDGVLDSTTIVDNWQWLANPVAKPTTTPLSDPK